MKGTPFRWLVVLWAHHTRESMAWVAGYLPRGAARRSVRTVTKGCTVCGFPQLLHQHSGPVRGRVNRRGGLAMPGMATDDDGAANLAIEVQDESGRENEEEDGGGGEDVGRDDDAADADAEHNQVTDTLIGMVKWYKTTISPLLAPACRFYPTCSSYSIESLERYGPVRGLVLTAWRLLRCNPVGGKGWDPPIWPPPGYVRYSHTSGRVSHLTPLPL